ncbi:FAD-dependent oxidoreductase [Tahibacter amnicola]|uniref:FAD-dependent oxidoreductase n=1 Tax=Tahibacter amnicola TaxID=2976241 RepID=A0ABY6BN75_9GAMM|nr:FAD-dependent oxidoreductase [Tahibacter amnicola]UXI69835.1 FAD-dependent oxidoreductase [Tahibacter amnicola]
MDRATPVASACPGCAFCRSPGQVNGAAGVGHPAGVERFGILPIASFPSPKARTRLHVDRQARLPARVSPGASRATRCREEGEVRPTDIRVPDYFHKVVDCQWACPAHTPVPEYIRLIAAGRYADAYLVNWKSNVFPGVLGRTCDRPCEPACRRVRVEENNGEKPEPVAICRLKRVAADNKGDVRQRLPKPGKPNGKRIACVGAGPASLTVARDLAPLGYSVTVFDGEAKAGGFIRTQIPRFRLPESVIDEETGYILDLGVAFRGGERIDSLARLLGEGYDAVFIGCGAPRGRDLDLPGRAEASANIHIGIDWLASVSFGHIEKIGRRVIVLGGGNTAMDCCRSARRLGGEDVKVLVRSGFDEMKASPWEKEDAQHEGIPILDYHVPKAFLCEQGRLVGMQFERVRAEYDAKGRRKLVPTGEPDVTVACDDVLIAVGQENAFPWIERDIGLVFDEWNMPVVDPATMQSSLPHVFFGGDAAFGPKNIIWAVAHGHEAAVSIDRFLHGEAVSERPPPQVNLLSQKMGIHEWSYENEISPDDRFKVPWAATEQTLGNIRMEVELGFDLATARKETQRCLNCDVQTVFSDRVCIECDACVDICPMDCISFTANADEGQLRTQLSAPALNLAQDLYVSGELKTGRVMVKDEDVCLHCGLCAERCPTGAWDMHKFLLEMTHAGPGCRSRQSCQEAA